MKIYNENKKASYDYNILEKFEAGLVLFGQEVKSIKTGHINPNWIDIGCLSVSI